MRPLEIAIPIVLGLRFAWSLFFTRRSRWVDWLPTFALVLCIVHIWIEGCRWQMILIYFLALVTFGFSIRDLREPETQHKISRPTVIARSIFALTALVIAFTLPILLPVPGLPQPTGPYRVGTLTKHLIDFERQELYNPHPGSLREVIVQIWYPAEADPAGTPAPWMEELDVMGPRISERIGMPSFFVDHVKYARTNSFPSADLPIGGDRFPVLLFSHGWGGFRQQSTYLVEELASHGYVVVAVQHPYGAEATVFPDGRIAYNKPQALPRDASEDEYLFAARQLVDQWAGDLSFVLDQLALDNQPGSDSPFSNHLDMGRVGVLGHSTGGGAAIEFCGRNPRCKAVLGLDAFLTPISQSVLDKGMEQPALFLYSELWPSERNDRLHKSLIENSDGPVDAYTVLGTDHYDFTDLPMLSPLSPYLGFKGPLEGKRTLDIIRHYSLEFFDSVFKGLPTNAQVVKSVEFPEVVFK